MSVKRSEFEIRVHTPPEVAGAEQGQELERVIAKARALGRYLGRLERQLARASERIRRLRRAHPVVEKSREREEKNEERQEREERQRMREVVREEEAGKGGSPRRSASRVQDGQQRTEDEFDQGEVPTSPDPGGGDGGWTGTIGPRAETDDPVGGQGGSGTGVKESPGTDWPEADDGKLPAAKWSEEEEGNAAEPATAAGEVPVRAVWNPEVRREIEQMVREALKDGEAARAKREDSQQESRLAAVETQLRMLQHRLTMNRDL
jgi:hypothetical protein